MEHRRLEELEKKVEAEKAQLEAKVKVHAEDHVAFKSLELRSREALQELYEKGLAKSLATDEEGPAKLLPQLVPAHQLQRRLVRRRVVLDRNLSRLSN